MVFLKEDGSLDIERINQLPTEEYIKMIDELTDEQAWRMKLKEVQL